MTLRFRILLGYGYLIALLLLAIGSALLGFLQLSTGIGGVLEENFASIQASMRMIDSLERQDSATLAALVEGEASSDQLYELEIGFLEALRNAENNVTEEREPAILESIEEEFLAYTEARDSLLASQPGRPLVAYDRAVFPLFEEVKREVLHLLSVNQTAMIHADRLAREKALRYGAWLGFLVAVALVSLVVISRVLRREILARLEELRLALGRMAGGHLSRRLPEDGDDELAGIARYVNRILDRHQALEPKFQARLALERRRVLALVSHLDGDVALFGLDGERLAGSDASWTRDRSLSASIREASEDRGDTVPGAQRLTLDGETVRIEPLSSRDRPVAWLARHRPEE